MGAALLPMTIHLSASFSYDVMIMGCVFYLTAICLDLAYEKDRVRLVDVAVLALLMAAAGPCKMVYGVLMGLCLLIPVKKFGGCRGGRCLGSFHGNGQRTDHCLLCCQDGGGCALGPGGGVQPDSASP